MPGFDGTGPMGEGPLTGRGLGRCGPGFARRGRGAGRGYGRSFRGRGIGGMFRGLWNYGYQAPGTLSNTEEKELLLEDAKELETELTDIKKRLKELEGGSK